MAELIGTFAGAADAGRVTTVPVAVVPGFPRFDRTRSPEEAVA